MASPEHHENAFTGVQMTDNELVEMGVARPRNRKSNAVRSEFAVGQGANLFGCEADADPFPVEILVPLGPLGKAGQHICRELERRAALR